MRAPSRSRLERFSHALGNLVPDATSASVVLLVVVVCAALATGNAPRAVGGAYYRGLWMLLPFTMQADLGLYRVLLNTQRIAGPHVHVAVLLGLRRAPVTTAAGAEAPAGTAIDADALSWRNRPSQPRDGEPARCLREPAVSRGPSADRSPSCWR